MPATYPLHGYTIRPYGSHYGHTVERDGRTVAEFIFVDETSDDVWFNWDGKIYNYPTLGDAILALLPLEQTTT